MRTSSILNQGGLERAPLHDVKQHAHSRQAGRAKFLIGTRETGCCESGAYFLARISLLFARLNQGHAGPTKVVARSLTDRKKRMPTRSFENRRHSCASKTTKASRASECRIVTVGA